MTRPAGHQRLERRRAWVRLDNASNIFLAARNEVDTKVFRLAAELDEQIDPAVLQQALDQVYAQYPLFRAVLRRGVFWYYLQESQRAPLVAPDVQPSVTHLYRFDSRELLFRVLYRGQRISLEVFHALTDGTGSLWFFQDLLTEYVGLRHLDEFTDASPPAPPGVKQEFAVDAFTHWFRSRTGEVPFAADATAGVESVSDQIAEEGSGPGGRSEAGDRGGTPARRGPAADRRRRGRARVRARDVVRVRGVATPDRRARVVELSMPVKPVLARARAEGVSLTIYLIAVLFVSLRSVAPRHRRARTMTVSVPVDLRQFFPTDSGRNFFATTLLAYTFRDGAAAREPRGDVVSDICRDLNEQFQALLTHESLERRIRRLIAFERHPVLRVIPRPLKDRLLSTINWFINRGITVAMSNLGRVELPEPVRDHVDRLYFHVSAIRPQFCVISHGDRLTVSFTSPFVETDYHREFVRHWTGQGIPVEVNVTRVTVDELAATVPSTRIGP